MAQKVLRVCGPKFMVAIIFDQNADPDPPPLKILGSKFFVIFFTFGFTKFRLVVS